MEELRSNAKLLQSTHLVPAISANAVVYVSDALINDKVMSKLTAGAVQLEDVPELEKDWHPRSKGQVLDLVHPSLFPLVYGKTLVLHSGKVPMEDAVLYCGKGGHVPKPMPTQLKHEAADFELVLYSDRFQWLPCQVDLLDDGSVKITSYINNLHPAENQELYDTVETIVSSAIPAWNLTLTELFKEERKAEGYQPKELTHGYYPPRIHVKGMPDWKVDEPVVPEGEDPETYDTDFVSIEYGVNWERSGLVQPKPSEETYNARRKLYKQTVPIDLRNQFANTGPQIIVKLANIHLSPENPVYEGGKWHIEGQLNEHICASALLYYDNDNITESYLAFRERVDADAFVWGNKDEGWDRGYQQFEYDHMEQLFGVQQNESHAVQYLGRVLTKEGRLVVFPNVLQHRVEPFRLEDSSKSGHRKILAVFLVDPYLRIPSTANVPPQRMDWWAEKVRSLDRIAELPPELVDNILDQAGDSPITLEEAKELRLELMTERTAFVDKVNNDYEQETFNFCEH